MNSSIDDFMREHDEFSQLVNAYAGAYADGVAADATRRNQDRQELLHDLDVIEQGYSSKITDIEGTVAGQLSRLDNIDRSIAEQEGQVSQRNLERAKRRVREARRDASALGADEGHPEAGDGDTASTPRPVSPRNLDVHARTMETMGAIQEIAGSRMPRFLSRFADYIELPGRRRKYDRIAQTHSDLDEAILARLSALQSERETGRAAADAVTLRQLDLVQQKADELSTRRDAEAQTYSASLKNLLLDGMEVTFSPESAYAQATTDLAGYLSAYTDAADADGSPWGRGLFLGIVNQPVTAYDDGTLDTYLSAVLPDGTYGNGTILLPVVLSRHIAKPICVNYFSEHVDGVYDLFSNYAVQMMALYGDETLSVNLVDCTHAGGKYAAFNACSDEDEGRRINIVQTKEELTAVLSDLMEHVIESNSLYLKDAYASVEEYNQSAVMKREIKAIFVSSLNELSNENLETLMTIARTGCRCGVLVFVGVSSDEFQASGVITRARATATTNLANLCDRIYMDSGGTLGLGNGRPALVAPPAMSPAKATAIMRRAVTNQGKSSTLPLEGYLPLGSDILSGSCKERLDIPVGQTPQGTEYVISFHKDASYMLLGGNPSAGKSSLIHTMILQCITRYRPEDLEIYIADLKDGSEFDAYAAAGVRSVRAVLDDSESDLATSFLQFIKNEISDRLQKFGTLQDRTGRRIRNIEEFYEVNEQNNGLVDNIPRLLLIVDEFQSLYTNNRQTGELTNWILRMGRTVGVIVVFSSQRSLADVSTSNSSFGSQTKEYFIYRAMMKLPYSGAKDIMSDRCADTGRENPALRKAQTLKVGQAIINSNMGATEEDSQLIQCYYPSSTVIDAICSALVAEQGRRDDSFILGSDKPVRRPRPVGERIALGESNRFHADGDTVDDEFHDDMVVTLDPKVGAIGVYGVSEAAFGSTVQACHAALGTTHDSIKVVLLAKGRIVDSLASAVAGTAVTDNPEDFLAEVASAHDGGSFVIAVVAEPYLWPELSQNTLGRNGAKVDELLALIDDEQAFVVVCSPDIKRMKTQAGWHDDAIPIRILSVGNPALLRQMVSTDVSNRIQEGSFNIARSDITKAYYYNRTTGKFGRMRMFPVAPVPTSLDDVAQPVTPDPSDLQAAVDGLTGMSMGMDPQDTQATSQTGAQAGSGDGDGADGWAGLSGN